MIAAIAMSKGENTGWLQETKKILNGSQKFNGSLVLNKSEK